ncbi:MAG: T9SS type A sorting domain-containing protein [Bacteroidales bacterium]|nr:T9SS type A sorting domain-containing protein [Bacteroidales bacterium]
MNRLFAIRELFLPILTFTLLVMAKCVFSQLNPGGEPPSFLYPGIDDNFQIIYVGGIDYESIRNEDERNDKNGNPYRYGVVLETDIDVTEAGTITALPGSGRIWRLKLVATGALALGLCFDRFHLPEGGKLFFYSEDGSYVRGAYTSINNSSSGIFAAELIPGESVTIEYFEPDNIIGEKEILLSEMIYAYRSVGFILENNDRNFGDSDFCEVNINCSEGSSWQDQKKGVVKISAKNGGVAYWCTGVLLNNQRNDYEPYIITADHCAYHLGHYADENDLNKWIFYFNYEAAECENPDQEPGFQTLVGATFRSQGGNTGSTGSDFYLVELNQQIPASVNPFFNGWDREDISSPSGVTIHHPMGDLKKISTYTTPLVTVQWLGNGLPSHWKVTWSETENNHGVTEGGSSGSPLYDLEGFVVGTLTGGEASCQYPTGPDYYGKFSYHWESNGDDPQSRLKDWLDPDNTGIPNLNGIYYENLAVANFTTDTNAIPVKGSIDFTDISSGDPYQWEWIFQRGAPQTSIDQNPTNVQYHSIGKFDVTLIVTGEMNSDTITKTDYISVEPVISPNPTNGIVKVFLGDEYSGNVQMKLFNNFGAEVKARIQKLSFSAYYIDLSQNRAGVYYLEVSSDEANSVQKISYIK